MTTQDLRNNRQQIIEKIIELGCESETKKFMELMVMDVDFHKGTIEELVMDVFNSHFRERAKRSGHNLAELVGNNDDRTYSILDKNFSQNK